MKKGLVVVFGLMAVMLLSGCGNNGNEPTIEPEVHKVSLEELYGKVSLDLNDLDAIDELLFPTSYSYEAYQLEDWSIDDAGEYVYPEGVDHKLLLPIHGSMVSREITSSSVEDWMIYTKANLMLDNGKTATVLYINDLETLQYAFASVSDETKTILYTFNY